MDVPWRLVGAYYNWHQNSYIPGSTTVAGAAGAPCTGPNALGRSATQCSGDFNQGSFLIDYTVNRHFDVYAGVTFTDIDGGLAGNFPD